MLNAISAVGVPRELATFPGKIERLQGGGVCGEIGQVIVRGPHSVGAIVAVGRQWHGVAGYGFACYGQQVCVRCKTVTMGPGGTAVVDSTSISHDWLG